MKNECSMAKKIESFKKNEKGGIGNTGMWFDFYDSEEAARADIENFVAKLPDALRLSGQHGPAIY